MALIKCKKIFPRASSAGKIIDRSRKWQLIQFELFGLLTPHPSSEILFHLLMAMPIFDPTPFTENVKIVYAQLIPHYINLKARL